MKVSEEQPVLNPTKDKNHLLHCIVKISASHSPKKGLLPGSSVRIIGYWLANEIGSEI